MNNPNLLIFAVVVVVVWCLITYFWPRMLLSVFKRGFLRYGLGEGPVPINTLCTQPQALFADPLNAPASAPKVITSGVNHDTLLTAGWLDLIKGSQILHVPEMHGRYYSVQFTDPTKNTVFAYVGKRTTGTQSGDYLITGPGWKGKAPDGMKQITSPKNGVMVIGRVLVESDSDLPEAYDLSKQIQLTPFSD
ncbi:MAG: DUF1254 domain-containing protein [Anaerolineaceae bacterium]|nr:DUF1254 domain-containing protein [Anaerolineaceae bacterium]